jgi:hypothetical protein
MVSARGGRAAAGYPRALDMAKGGAQGDLDLDRVERRPGCCDGGFIGPDPARARPHQHVAVRAPASGPEGVAAERPAQPRRPAAHLGDVEGDLREERSSMKIMSSAHRVARGRSCCSSGWRWVSASPPLCARRRGCRSPTPDLAVARGDVVDRGAVQAAIHDQDRDDGRNRRREAGGRGVKSGLAPLAALTLAAGRWGSGACRRTASRPLDAPRSA